MASVEPGSNPRADHLVGSSGTLGHRVDPIQRTEVHENILISMVVLVRIASAISIRALPGSSVV